MSRFDNIGLFWEDRPSSRKRGERELGPMPSIPDTGWRTPSFLPDISRAPIIAFDCETFDPELTESGAGWGRGRGHIVGISCAIPGERWYFPMRHEVQPEMNMNPEEVLRWAKHMLGQPMPKVGANLIYDVGWLRQEGVKVAGKLYDVQFAEALLNEESKVNLEALGHKYTGAGKATDILKDWCMNYYGTGVKTWRKDIYRAPVSLVGHYGEVDASLPLEVLQRQWPLLEAEGQLDLFELECSLINLLVDMRFAGVRVDVNHADRLRDTLQGRANEIQAKIDAIAGFSVNINAADSLARAFDGLGLSYPRTAATAAKPDGSPSFVKEFLAHHPHEFPQLVTEVRGLLKLKGTFVEGYLLNKNVNGQVYGSFNPLSGTEGGAKTGRFASADPNLQNIPTRTAEGKLIREAFIPDEGHLEWWKFDYSQIEYRILAHYAVGEGADQIRQMYINDPRTDYHASTAALIEKVTGVKLSRSHTKNINFGLAYGMGLAKLAKDLGVSMKEAQELSEAYHRGVPFARETMKLLSDFAQQYGYNQTILGRRTRFNLWEPASWGVKGKALEYPAALAKYGTDIKRAYLYRTLNYTLQGSSADMMKKAMATCYYSGIFDVTGVPRLTVHDELDFSVTERSPAVMEAMREMHHIMQTVIPLRVPVICDLDVGPNWGKVEETDTLQFLQTA